MATRNRAANALTHAASAISLASGSGGNFFASLDPPRCLRRRAAAEVSVLPATLISGIRRHGLTVSDSYDSLQGSRKTSDGYADEL
jgi:hypothetical protein